MQSLQQQRAKSAWEFAQAAQQKFSKSPDEFTRYANLAKKAPALIMTNGLGQTLAFFWAKSKGKDNIAEGLLYQHLQQWLIGNEADFHKPYKKSATTKSSDLDLNATAEAKASPALIDAITTGDSATYLRATAEALAFLNWLKNFAAGLQS
jgi:CRISPR-associated protein Cmr5